MPPHIRFGVRLSSQHYQELLNSHQTIFLLRAGSGYETIRKGGEKMKRGEPSL